MEGGVGFESDVMVLLLVRGVGIFCIKAGEVECKSARNNECVEPARYTITCCYVFAWGRKAVDARNESKKEREN